MTLEEFIAEMKKDIDKFEVNWRKQNVAKPEHWPMEMNEGDWYEQFLMFEASGEK